MMWLFFDEKAEKDREQQLSPLRGDKMTKYENPPKFTCYFHLLLHFAHAFLLLDSTVPPRSMVLGGPLYVVGSRRPTNTKRHAAIGIPTYDVCTGTQDGDDVSSSGPTRPPIAAPDRLTHSTVMTSMRYDSQFKEARQSIQGGTAVIQFSLFLSRATYRIFLNIGCMQSARNPTS